MTTSSSWVSIHDLAVSCDVVVLQNVPKDVHRLAGRIVQRWWKPHGLPEALHRLEASRAIFIRLEVEKFMFAVSESVALVLIVVD
jgi:2-polyprenyl-3-methyl-5-hydroxy-6-metoxy-1,4-benzoquinol methylase